MQRGADALPKGTSWAGPVVLLAAAGTAGLGLWATHRAGVPFWSPIGLLALTAVVGVVWLTRVRAARRLFMAVDAYAEQELARAKRSRNRMRDSSRIRSWSAAVSRGRG